MPEDLKKLEQTAREIGLLIGKAVERSHDRQKVGFALVLFDYGEGGHLTYISSAQRADMIKALREFLGKVESN